MFDGIVEPYLETMVVLWTRASRRSLARAINVPVLNDPDEIAERYGEFCLGVIALDHALRLVAAHVRRSGQPHPVSPGGTSLSRRVSRLRNLIEHEDVEIARGFLVRVEEDALVGRQNGAIFRLPFADWERCLDQINDWAIAQP